MKKLKLWLRQKWCKHEHEVLRDDVFRDIMLCLDCGRARGLTDVEQFANRRSSVID